jgi:hypothetical protein
MMFCKITVDSIQKLQLLHTLEPLQGNDYRVGLMCGDEGSFGAKCSKYRCLKKN